MNPNGGGPTYPFQQHQHQDAFHTSPKRPSPHNSNSNSSGPRAKCDQVVFEAIAKAAEIVVASRCWIGSSPTDAVNGGATGSGRFNLLVPEVKSVRSILQRWKRTMHVPLRLDVYYQHPPTAENENGERELLERWCLEYAPHNTHATATNEGMMYNNNNNNNNMFHVDPIVQLRKVCKNIVVWLRTLYCHSRLLPAQALRRKEGYLPSKIGFSIYVVGEGQDDVSGLLRQGFDSEPKSNTGVPTPYGVLGWKVYLAPKELVHKLLAMEAPSVNERQSFATLGPTKSIPMKVVSQHHGFPNSKTPPPASSPSSGMIARSAPGHGYRRANSSPIERTHALLQQHQQQSLQKLEGVALPGTSLDANGPNLIAPRSYHPRSHMQRRHTEDFTETPNHSIATSTNTSAENTGTNTPSSVGSRGIASGKNLSALSLALMTMKDKESTNDEEVQHSTGPQHRQQTPEEIAASEKRRAALHNAPPTAVGSSAGEYGYAYNANTSNAAVSSSPSSTHFRGPSTPCSSTLGTTPPGYLLSGTPSMGSHIGAAGLIPPARLSGASASSPKTTNASVTPPFVRPLGFSGQPATSQLSSEARPKVPPTETNGSANLGLATPTSDDPKPSLDLLHSSPFQWSTQNQQPEQNDGLSSFLQAEETATIAAATTFINDFYHHHYQLQSHGVDDIDLFPDATADDDGLVLQAEDMPFAVDGISSSNAPCGHSMASVLSNKHDATSLVASVGVGPPKRLAMFESKHGEQKHLDNFDNEMVESLADQLEDFKSFGASLMAAGTSTGGPAALTTSVGSGG